jgi:hypothetical protein
LPGGLFMSLALIAEEYGGHITKEEGRSVKP